MKKLEFSVGEIPDSLFTLTQLESLRLGWNKELTEIPEAIGNLTNLKCFNLNYSEFVKNSPSRLVI